MSPAHSLAGAAQPDLAPPRLYRPESESSFLPRMVSATASGVLFSLWMPALWAALWVAAIFGWELWLNARVVQPRLLAIAEVDPRRAEWLSTGVMAFGATLYTAGWTLALLYSGLAAGFVAAAWFAASLMHGVSYYAHRPLDFAALCAPCVASAVVTPWFVATPAAAMSMSLVAILLLGSALRGLRDRTQLVTRMAHAAMERDQAHQAVEERKRVLACMTHELRTPLHAVIGYAELIEEEARAGGSLDQAGADAARIQAAALHLLALVNDSLDLAKVGAGRMELQPQPTDVAALLEEVAALLQPLAVRGGNHLAVDARFAAGRAMLDPGRLKQCLLNLGGNACKFTQDGRIDLAARFETLADGRRGLRIEVRDTGPGFSQEAAAQLFQPFTQLDGPRAAEGAGLGLAITQALAELQGGSVRADSAPGQGAVFTLIIAAPAPPAEGAALAA